MSSGNASPSTLAGTRPSAGTILLTERGDVESTAPIAPAVPATSRHNLTDKVVLADVALDLVLEQIVYQARLSTGATGAFLGLVRNGQMVYRAMNGATSAEFVAYLRRDPRMVDACLRTSAVQHCRNSDNASGLDMSVCRILGARSMVLVPVLKETEEKLGVLGAFSSQADAFASRDLVPLQSLSRRVADTMARVDDLAYDLAVRASVPGQWQEVAKRFFRIPAEYTRAVAVTLTSGARRPLGVALMVGVSLLVGWALTRSVTRGRLRPSSKNSTMVVPQSSAPAQAPSVADSPFVRPPVNPTAIVPVPAKTSNPVSARAEHHVPDLEIEDPVDGTSSGIVLFEGAEAQSTSTRSRDSSLRSASPSPPPVIIRERTALEHVVDRVEPEYPDEAKANHVQGSVVLDVLVGKDGKVRGLSLVRGDLALTAAAADAVRQWRFKPLIRNGRPGSFESHITLTFALP
jgi:TonB family protein